VGVGLVGCGETSKVGTAAIVGDERISVIQLQANVERVLDERAAQATGAPDRTDVTSGELQRQLLGRMISSRLLAVVAGELGAPSVTPGQVDQLIAGVRQQGGEELVKQRAAELNIAFADLRDFVRDEQLTLNIFGKLGPAPRTQEEFDALQVKLGERLAKAEDAVGVTVNPRYGRWDPATRRVVRGRDDLTQPAPGGEPGGTGQLPGGQGSSGGPGG
jgi:hypothetical protein